jgi:hypothetical protein
MNGVALLGAPVRGAEAAWVVAVVGGALAVVADVAANGSGPRMLSVISN